MIILLLSEYTFNCHFTFSFNSKINFPDLKSRTYELSVKFSGGPSHTNFDLSFAVQQTYQPNSNTKNSQKVRYSPFLTAPLFVEFMFLFICSCFSKLFTTEIGLTTKADRYRLLEFLPNRCQLSLKMQHRNKIYMKV